MGPAGIADARVELQPGNRQRLQLGVTLPGESPGLRALVTVEQLDAESGTLVGGTLVVVVAT